MSKASENINIRVTPEQKALISALAADYKKTKAELIVMMSEYVAEKRPVFKSKSATGKK